MKRRAFAFLCMTSLIAAACGDDGGKVHTIADSNKTPDARVCVGATPATSGAGALDFLSYASDSSGGVIRWVGDMNEMIDGYPAFYQVAFYSGIESSLTGTFDLTAGNQNNYDTCAICIRAFTYDPSMGNKIVKRFYQSGGSVTLNKDPFGVGKNLDMTITNLQLEESTFDMNAHSDPVAGGTCLNYTGTSLMHDSVPNEFMGSGAQCARQNFNSGGTCSCMCGVLDPDCVDTNTTTANFASGCSTGMPACSSTGTCVAIPANDTCTLAAANAIAVNGAATAGTTEGARHNYSAGLATCLGYLDNNNQPIANPMPGPDVAYMVNLSMGTSYTFKLTNLDPNVDLSLSLVGPGTAGAPCDGASTITTCVKGSDQGFDGEDETFTFSPTASGNYYLIVDSYIDTNANSYGNFASSGAFKIQVTQP